MTKGNDVFSVLTGDVVNSSQLVIKNRAKLPDILKASFSLAKEIIPRSIHSDLDIFRGDSFQGVLRNPELSLKASLLIRTQLIFKLSDTKIRKAVDARIAIGIGTIDFVPKNRKGSEGDGQAFKLSGIGLDEMKKNQRLVIRTPWSEINEELETECALIDGLINRWSGVQAEAMAMQLQNKTQEEMAKELGIKQPAVFLRLKSAGGWAVDVFCRRFEALIKKAKYKPQDL